MRRLCLTVSHRGFYSPSHDMAPRHKLRQRRMVYFPQNGVSCTNWIPLVLSWPWTWHTKGVSGEFYIALSLCLGTLDVAQKGDGRRVTSLYHSVSGHRRWIAVTFRLIYTRWEYSKCRTFFQENRKYLQGTCFQQVRNKFFMLFMNGIENRYWCLHTYVFQVHASTMFVENRTRQQIAPQWISTIIHVYW